MKKRNIALLAGLTIMLTGCMGTRYTVKAVESDDKHSITVTQSLSIQNKEEGTGKFSLSTRSVEKYNDGYFKGFLGMGEVNGDVTYKVTGRETGTWSINETTNVVTLSTYKLVMKVTFSGDGAEDYKDICEPLLAVAYGEDNAQKLVAGESVTIEYSEDKAVKSYIKLDDANKTFAAVSLDNIFDF